MGSWQHWTDLSLLPAPTNSKPDRLYQPTTQSTSAPQNTTRTAERTPTSHQQRSPCNVCLLPRRTTVMRLLSISCSTAHCTTTSEPHYCQPSQRHRTRYESTTQLQRTATYNMSAMNRRDKIVRSPLERWNCIRENSGSNTLYYCFEA